eukprot:2649337-Lingulodinium_polyedra.AAC.1
MGPCRAACTNSSKLTGPWTEWVIPWSAGSAARGACAPGCPSGCTAALELLRRCCSTKYAMRQSNKMLA